MAPEQRRAGTDSERFRHVAATFAGSATVRRILPAMPLPADFRWTTRSASRPDDPLTVIACHGVWVVAMAQRVNDGIWIASLDRHRHGPGGPFRWCTSYEQGVIGSELWAVRHQQRLRLEIDQREVARAAQRKNRTW